MSDSDSLEEAVEWFESLAANKKERIIDGFGSDLDLEDAGRFRDLVFAVRENVSIDGTQQAVDLLKSQGMGMMFAEELVEKTVHEYPPTSLIVAELNNLPNEEFQHIVDYSIRQYSEAINHDQITEGVETSQTVPQRLRDTIQAVYMELLRGEYHADYALEQYVELGLDEGRAQYVIESYIEYEDITWRRLVFRNTQQVRTEDVGDLRDQQREIRGLLDQLLTIVEDAARNTDT